MRAIVSVLGSRRTYLRLGHTVGGAFACWVYLTVLSIALPLVLALVIIWVGIPLLLLVLALVRGMAGFERHWANAWLGTDIPPPTRISELGTGAWARLRSVVTHSATWRGLVYLVLRSVIGVAAAIAGVVWFATILGLALCPFFDGAVTLAGNSSTAGWHNAWAPPVAVAVGVGGLLAGAGVGWLTGLLAGALLGPSQADRVRHLEATNAELGERTRLARDLHDSVGHTMTMVVVQAGAARTVFDRDPQFARNALGTIEDAARRALNELDAVLGELRDEPTAHVHQPTLAQLDQLLAATRAAGVPLRVVIDGDIASVPDEVSQPAYRIVQEAFTNVIRHAGPVPTTVRVHASAGGVEITVHNDAGRPDPTTGRVGRGLQGVGERVQTLGGRLENGPAEDGGYRLHAVLPYRTPERL